MAFLGFIFGYTAIGIATGVYSYSVPPNTPPMDRYDLETRRFNSRLMGMLWPLYWPSIGTQWLVRKFTNRVFPTQKVSR